MKKITRFAYPALVMGGALSIVAYWLSGYWQSLALSLVSVFLGFGVALLVINGFINEGERKKAAVVLLQMVLKDVSEYHNLFIRKGHDKFGIPTWNEIIDTMNQNKRNPDALTPEQRTSILEILSENKDEILSVTASIDERFREISYILGWSFHPKIVRDAMLSRMEIAKLQTLVNAESLTDDQKKEAIEIYFDFDADSSAVLTSLAGILGISLTDG